MNTKVYILLLLVFANGLIFSQEPEEDKLLELEQELKSESDTVLSSEKDDNMETEVIQDSTQEEADTNYFDIGKKRVEIIERNDSTYVKVWEEDDESGKDGEVEDEDDESDFDWDFDFGEESSRFRGHWTGFEFGMNNYVDENFSLNRNSENEFMDISTNRSWNFNLNFAQFSIPLASSKYTGFVVGLGLEWSNYHFSGSSTIIKNTDSRQIETYDYNTDLKLNRFQTTYLTVPLLYEVQFFKGSRSDRMYLSAGVIGGIKLGAHTKVKYSDAGYKKTHKDKDDFYLRQFRYGFTGRLGYKLVKIYVNYYPVSLFLEDRGPELYPFAMGFCVAF